MTDQARAQARKLFAQGNVLFERDRYGQALERYREAVLLWDHPAIHFNITVCLINLDQPIGAYEHLERALAFGVAALGVDHHAQAQTYSKLLRGQLARLTVECAQDDVRVTLDGKQLTTCPGTATRFLLPGEHQLVANKPGLPPVARSIDLRAGETVTEELVVRPAPPTTHLERRWKPWVPWLPVGGGAAIVAVGIGLRASAVSHAGQFDREVQSLCPQGCPESDLPQTVRDLETQVRAQNASSISMFAIGGTAIVAGGILLVLNRKRERETVGTSAMVVPTLGRRTLGVSLNVPF